MRSQIIMKALVSSDPEFKDMLRYEHITSGKDLPLCGDGDDINYKAPNQTKVRMFSILLGRSIEVSIDIQYRLNLLRWMKRTELNKFKIKNYTILDGFLLDIYFKFYNKICTSSFNNRVITLYYREKEGKKGRIFNYARLEFYGSMNLYNYSIEKPLNSRIVRMFISVNNNVISQIRRMRSMSESYEGRMMIKYHIPIYKLIDNIIRDYCRNFNMDFDNLVGGITSNQIMNGGYPEVLEIISKYEFLEIKIPDIIGKTLSIGNYIISLSDDLCLVSQVDIRADVDNYNYRFYVYVNKIPTVYHYLIPSIFKDIKNFDDIIYECNEFRIVIQYIIFSSNNPQAKNCIRVIYHYQWFDKSVESILDVNGLYYSNSKRPKFESITEVREMKSEDENGAVFVKVKKEFAGKWRSYKKEEQFLPDFLLKRYYNQIHNVNKCIRNHFFQEKTLNKIVKMNEEEWRKYWNRQR
jgi:hypothetical protein